MLVKSFPGWLKASRLSGAVPVDVLQNSISGQLFEGRKKGLREKFLEYVKAGGPNIIFLCAAGLLALALAVERLITLTRRQTDAERFVEKLTAFAGEGQTGPIDKMLRGPSTLARCLRLLWPHRGAARDAAEKSLKEAFSQGTAAARTTVVPACGARRGRPAHGPAGHGGRPHYPVSGA